LHLRVTKRSALTIAHLGTVRAGSIRVAEVSSTLTSVTSAVAVPGWRPIRDMAGPSPELSCAFSPRLLSLV
jgi:hypothetical protein